MTRGTVAVATVQMVEAPGFTAALNVADCALRVAAIQTSLSSRPYSR
jgi:hypothetical protein